MNEEIENIKKRIKAKRNTNIGEKKENMENSYFKNLISRFLISIILVLISMIYINGKEENKLLYKEQILTKNFSFTKINNWYQKYFGNIVPIDIEDKNTEMVFDSSLKYQSIEEYKNGHKLIVEPNTIINAISSGIIVYMGEKDDYDNVIIVQGIDGVDIWYGNITNTNLNLYDYVEEGTLLGESKKDYLYLVLNKDGEYLNYEKYIAENKN